MKIKSFLRAVILASAITTTSNVLAQGYPPSEAVSHMTLPDGLEAKLVASEPMIAQPVSIEFDDRGRLWVMQYLQYPNPAGLKRVKVDRFSRTVYDRVPEPPPKGPKGADRITILEDVDANGLAHKSHDFINGLNLATGIAFGHGGVYVLQVPYLLFYPDKNHDDVPDGDPEVCLSGFGMEDAHSVANSLTWGPDGWLYGCQGSTVTANIRGIEFQQGVWRYHPITHKFELFCEGGGNSWGLDFDRHGDLFYSTNLSPYRMLHGVQGAYYWKAFGKHGALHNPYAFGYFEHVAHKNFTGGHVTDGGIIYQGNSLPEKYWGKYIANDLLGHTVLWHNLWRDGSTWSSEHGGEILNPHDAWFDPSDLTMGPDGSLFVADWFDKRTAHPDPDADWDKTNGRVYKIEAKGVKPYTGGDLTTRSSAELVAMLSDPNDWYVRKARRILADRRDPSVIAPLKAQINDNTDEHLALESLWALYVSGGWDQAYGVSLLSSKNSDLRYWNTRFLGDEDKISDESAAALAQLAANEQDVRVRSQLASTAKRLPASQCMPIIEQLLTKHDDSKDLHIPLLTWWAVEKHAIDGRDLVLKFFCSSDAWNSAIGRETDLPRLMQRYAAQPTEENLLACAALLKAAPSEKDKLALVASFEEELPNSQTAISAPQALLDQLDSLWSDSTTDVALIKSLTRLSQPKALDRANAIAMDSHAPLKTRIALLDLVPADSLLKLVDSKESDDLRVAALGALQSHADETNAKAVFDQLPTMPTAVRSRAVEFLLSHPASAHLLLDSVEAKTTPSSYITLDQIRQVALYKDKNLNEIVRKFWGAVKNATPEEKLATVRRYNNDLRAFPGNAIEGKKLFTATCAQCHTMYGEGAHVGPDLTYANRHDRDFLLVSIVDPSAVVRSEFLAYIIDTTDGQTLTGIIAEQTSNSITLKNAGDKLTVIPREKIKSMRESTLSLMPEGLLSQMKPQQLRDLFAYLQSEKKP